MGRDGMEERHGWRLEDGGWMFCRTNLHCWPVLKPGTVQRAAKPPMTAAVRTREGLDAGNRYRKLRTLPS